jgi:DNA-binding NarL/FixJ family response regulator
VVGVDHLAIGEDGGVGVTIRVLLVDDQALLRQGFAMILAHEPDIEIVAEAGDGQEAVTVARSCAPDVVLMDIRMPVIDGVEATRRIVCDRAEVRVLILTTFDLDAYAFGALRAGASGFLLKDVRPEELVAAIRTVAAGDAVVSPRITRRLLDECAHLLVTAEGESDRTAAMAKLTEREREVLVAVADGLSNTEIAERLFVSEATIKSHVGRILGKLGLRDRVQAVVFAFQTGIVRPDRMR